MRFPPVVFMVVLATALSTVDFTHIPQCAWTDCFPFHSSSIGCPSLSQDCFCNALAPINCAAKNCTGGDWYAVEDWFATQCPNPPNVTLQALPQCSRFCVREALIPDYCQAQLTRNCFCRLEAVVDGLGYCLVNNCGENATLANTTVQNYYRSTCIYSPGIDGNGNPDTSSGGSGQDEVVNSPQPAAASEAESTGPTERLSLIIGLVSGFTGVILFVITVYVWMHRHRYNRVSCSNWLHFHVVPNLTMIERPRTMGWILL